MLLNSFGPIQNVAIILVNLDRRSEVDISHRNAVRCPSCVRFIHMKGLDHQGAR